MPDRTQNQPRARRGCARWIKRVAVAGAIAAGMIASGAPLAANSSTVVVPANVRTTNTGVSLAPGISAIVTARGTWDVCNGECPAGPEGATNGAAGACPGVEGEPAGLLIGSLDGGGTFVAVGAGPTVVTGTGELLLGPNDCGPYEDNSGAVEATVETVHYPTSVADCKNGWRGLREQDGSGFSNQGDCVSYVHSIAPRHSKVDVLANARTTDTGLAIAPGTSAVITAKGTWDVCSGGCPAGPDGATNGAAGACPGVEGRPAGELIGSLDGGATFFPLGAGPTVVAGSGELLLGPNDCGAYEDNSGTLKVKITLHPTS